VKGDQSWKHHSNIDNKIKKNKLFERRANSFIIASKTNIIEQLKKTNNKNQNKKLDVKGKDIVMKFNSKWFIYNKTGHWLVLKSAFLSRFYIIILHLKYQ